ncbi:MAG: methionyl-tRNA formyltransferase [Flavobacteriaceae bacterium]|nr:methionyl-tRNA formyltransferase [Flavobacteriaceae bacterium]
MNKKPTLPKIVFFGTPEFARFCLERLVTEGFPILAVVTAPDRKAGRGKKLKASAVKIYSEEQQLPLLQPENLKAPSFVDHLRTLAPTIQVVVAFRMLPKVVWQIPSLGTLNLHASLLPNYRGAAPINWVIINGESKTGVSTFLINEAIDTGALLLQKEIAIKADDTVGTLHDALLEIGAPLIVDTLIGLTERALIPKLQQTKGDEREAPKLTSENTSLNWNDSLTALVNKVRGLSPYPGAWSLFMNKGEEGRIKIFKASAVYEAHSNPLGQICIKQDEILIATQEGYLNCKEIQLPNKKRMTAEALLNGYTFDESARNLS